MTYGPPITYRNPTLETKRKQKEYFAGFGTTPSQAKIIGINLIKKFVRELSKKDYEAQSFKQDRKI